MMVGGWLLGLVLLALVVAGIVVVVRAFGNGADAGTGRRRDGPSRAVELLEERFAQGEIDREEFEERRRALDR